MDKKYYIFLALTAIFSLAISFVLTSVFYCQKDSVENRSLEGIKGEKDDRGKSSVDSCDFFVDVSGAVTNPGVVCVHDGAIVNDAIKKAGDINPQAYAFKYVAQRMNLARRLEEEEKIYIPFQNDTVCTFVEDESVKHASAVMEKLSLVDQSGKVDLVVDEAKKDDKDQVVSDTDCININTASKDKLMELPGIGETRARDVIEGRPYSQIEDIKNVSGIGDATFNNIKDLICV